MKKISYNLHPEIYHPEDISEVLQLAVNDANLIGNRKGGKVYNIPCAFDIETTSFYRDTRGNTYDYEQAQAHGGKLEKCAIMYVWQFGINGYNIMGRTWDEFITMYNTIVETLHLNDDKRLIVYVHNLSYEFQYIRTLFDWAKVFAIDLRKPIYATTKQGVEFRCSYLLSGYSLAQLGKQLHKYTCRKSVGDLDYRLLRHSQTPLLPTEIGYCINDIQVVQCYIAELIEQYKGITQLPITKTGYVRKYCRKHTLRTTDNDSGKSIQNYAYTDAMDNLKISGVDEFNALQRAFSGGFTHANANYVNEILSDVDSYDFTSSYPYVMISEQYPMSKGVKVQCKSVEQFEYLISRYCCVFDVEFTNISPLITYENTISYSKCFIRENVASNNGRVVCASRIALTITDVDYRVIKNFYQWKQMRVGTMWVYQRGYLPSELVKSILHLYKLKTQLKGVKGKEVEYLNSKEMLNSCYGMCVTNPLRAEYVYNNDWYEQPLNSAQAAETLTKYNNSRNRFLYYPWGVFVTAYARKNLFTAISAVGDDYVYSDTDSIKLLNGDTHKQYFEVYNNDVYLRLRKACKHHNIDISDCMPETIKGVAKTLGVWDYEGRYTRFKTLGAKRYMVQCNGALGDYDYSLTVSGVNKHTAIPYLLNRYGENIFEAFDNYLIIPPTATGKNIHTYIDYPISGVITDYLGNTCDYTENSGVHLEPTAYSLSLTIAYINYLLGIKTATR